MRGHQAALAAARKEAAGYRTRLREAEPFVAKAREREESQKTEAQRLTESHATEKQRADAAEGELRRVRAALNAGLDVDFADRLRGTTVEELEADAKSLAERLGAVKPAPDAGRKPKPKLGATTPVPADAPEDDDPASLAARIIKRRPF